MDLDRIIDSENYDEPVEDYYMSPEAQKSHPVKDYVRQVYENLRTLSLKIRDSFSYMLSITFTLYLQALFHQLQELLPNL